MFRRNNHRLFNRRGDSFGNNRNGHFGRGRRKTSFYKPTMFINNSSGETPEEFTPTHSFSDFQIHSILKQNIASKEYKVLTPIQDAAILPILEGRDVVGIANTGTGKTAAFLIPLIDKVLKNDREKVLVITPTRELAIQVEQELRELARGTRIQSVICIGGVGIGSQIHRLRGNSHFVMGTPGRLKDLESRRQLNFNSFRSIVLDEVDRMLDMGFIVDVSYIVSKLSRERHSLFFSATLPEKVQKIMRDFARDPQVFSLKSQPTPA